jgi:hypothetical protein
VSESTAKRRVAVYEARGWMRSDTRAKSTGGFVTLHWSDPLLGVALHGLPEHE